MKLGEWMVQFSGKYKQFINELSETGVSTAQGIFAGVDPEDGNADVTVTREFDGTTDFRIVASGDGASFAEFGTGVLTSLMGGSNVQAPYAIAPGSWSATHARQFSEKGYWMYNGKRFYGTPPYGGMQEAANVMKQQVDGIARGIFG